MRVPGAFGGVRGVQVPAERGAPGAVRGRRGRGGGGGDGVDRQGRAAETDGVEGH